MPRLRKSTEEVSAARSAAAKARWAALSEGERSKATEAARKKAPLNVGRKKQKSLAAKKLAAARWEKK